MKTCNLTDSVRFLAGEMSAVEIASFEDHLETCSDCQQRLESSAGHAEFWDTARVLLGSTLPKADDDFTGTETEWMPDCTTAQVLSFIGPTDDPSMIGRVGPYEISALLGRGSAGIVLKGFDRALSRNVAIKVLDPALAGVGAARQRFAREARAMAAISHEHLVSIYEVNEHAGLPFFAMEYIPGGSLDRRLRSQGTFEVVSVVRIGLQVAQALAAAHRQGLVHRDIKPGNILLDSGTDRVRVADFGLVRIANDVSCSRSGVIAGTPQYMAPEQVRAELCDPQSDLFSLGSVLYALCTGHPPFRADTLYGVMQRIAHDQPRSIREQNAAIPEWLEQFILKLLAKDRRDRFTSADQVSEILSRELLHLQCPQVETRPHREWLPRKTFQPSTLLKWWPALLTLCLLVAGIVQWNRSFLPPLSTSADTPALRPTAAAPNPSPNLTPSATFTESMGVPTWDDEGIAEFQRQLNDVEATWQATDAARHDLWPVELGTLLEQLQRLRWEEFAPVTPNVMTESQNSLQSLEETPQAAGEAAIDTAPVNAIPSERNDE